jgi:hypothetical protein
MAGSDEEEDSGQLTPRTKGIIQHFQRKVREYTDEIDNDLQVINEKIGQMETAQIFNSTKLARLETMVGCVDMSLAALLGRFDELHARTHDQHREEDERNAKNLSADYSADTEVEG